MERQPCSRDEDETARKILRYFLANPAAKDTLEGIAGWWLERDEVERTAEEVAEALRYLLERGFILERRGKAVRPYYKMNPAKRAEIAEFIELNRASNQEAGCDQAPTAIP